MRQVAIGQTMGNQMTYMVPARGIPRLIVTGSSLQDIWKELRELPGLKRLSSYITVPAELRLYEWLQQLEVQPDDKAVRWYTEQTKGEIDRIRWLAQEDCTSRHPEGSKLLPFQRVGAEFIARGGSALLCDDTGLGKTVQAIVGVETSRHHDRVLVVCLKTLQLWWQTTYQRWTSQGLPTQVLISSQRYEQLRAYHEGWLIVNYRQLLIVHQLQDVQWDWVIFDEGHTLCNRQTKTFAAASTLRTQHRLIVTATPYGNSPAEIWALLCLIASHRYRSYWRFYEMYVNYKQNYFGGREVVGVKNAALLRRELAPVMIRRRKVDVYPQLPEKTYQTIPLPMEEHQSEIYRKAAKEYIIDIENGADLTIHSSIAMIIRLRQITSSPFVFGVEGASIKIDFIKEFLETYPGKVVIFSLFRATIQDVCNQTTSQNITPVVVWGGMSSEETEAARQAFIAGEARVLLGTIAGAGTGLDLRNSGAEVAIFVDRHWNPTKQLQAEDRIHGIGQTKKVHIYNLHCPKTIDELVEKVLERKLAMTEEVLGQALREELERWK